MPGILTVDQERRLHVIRRRVLATRDALPYGRMVAIQRDVDDLYEFLGIALAELERIRWLAASPDQYSPPGPPSSIPLF